MPKKEMASGKPGPRSTLGRFLFLLYAGLMLWLLFGQRIGSGGAGTYAQQLRGNLNLVPFETIALFWNVLDRGIGSPLFRLAVVNLIGNVVMFVPLGFFLPLIFPRLRGFFKTLLCSAVLIAAVELVQLFALLGSCDIDDPILNLPGVAIGYLLWRITAGKK